jgi:hypothetical protein
MIVGPTIINFVDLKPYGSALVNSAQTSIMPIGPQLYCSPGVHFRSGATTGLKLWVHHLMIHNYASEAQITLLVLAKHERSDL